MNEKTTTSGLQRPNTAEEQLHRQPDKIKTISLMLGDKFSISQQQRKNALT